MKRRWWSVAAVLIVCTAVFLTGVERVGVVGKLPEIDKTVRPLVTVDAGHGGFDGGASAPDGTMEKTLNLEMSEPLSAMLLLCGFEVKSTRTADVGLHEDDTASIREKKISDMKARLALYDSADLNIAVHQNNFGDARYSGTQVFYSDNHALSKPLAEAVRSGICERLQPDNTRELKTGNKDIYLLYKTQKPTVLVECGFLSNTEELARLKDPQYQRQLMLCVTQGVVQYATTYLWKDEVGV